MKLPNNTAGREELTAIAEAAYIFAYPMLENYRTMDRMTGINTPPSRQRAFNTLRHTSKLLGPDFKNIVAPNNDTLYSSTWLDLDLEPQVVSVPEIPDQRYYVFQMVNMYNHNFGYIGARTTGYTPGDYLIAGHSWQGPIPAGIRQAFRSETRFAYLLGRTLVDGPADLDQVKAIQAGYRLQSLSQYLGRPSPSAESARHIMPYDAEKALTAEFIAYLNFILGNAMIHPDEAGMIQRFAGIGIAPGQPFRPDSLRQNELEAINRGIRRARKKIEQKVKEIGRVTNGWRSLEDSHGPREVMAGRYLQNAAGAMAGLYGNDKEEASNFAAFVDETGAELNASEHAYVVKFDADGFPPVNAFWSITMYRLPEILLVSNPIDRYSIGNRTRELKYGADGSLEIYVQHNSPGPDRESNWLPAPRGPFILALRNYWPDVNRFSKYAPPAIKK